MWTMRRRDGNGLDCTTFLLRVLNNAFAPQPELFNAAMAAVLPSVAQQKTGSSKSAAEISGASILIGMQKALGWQGFFVWGSASSSMSDAFEPEDVNRYKDAHDGSWHRVKVSEFWKS